MVVWGLRDGCEAGFEEEYSQRAKEEQWIQAPQVIVEEDYPAFRAAKDFLQFARHQDVHRWLHDRQLLARSKSEAAAALRKMLPDLKFRESILNMLK